MPEFQGYVFPIDPWLQSVYDGTMAQFGKVKIESKLVGCPVVMDFEDGRRSSGTITGVGDVKYDHGKLLSYVLTVEEFPRWKPTTSSKRVVHRASLGLKKPPAEYIPGSFGEASSTIAKRLDRLIRQVAANTYIPPQYWVSPDVSRMDR